MLKMVYTTPEDAARDVQALTNLVASAIPTETFILFTSFNLREDEMVIHTPFQHHGHHMCMTRRALTHSAPLAFPASPGYLRGHTLLETIRATAHRRMAPNYETPPRQVTSFCPISLTPSRSPCSGPRISRPLRSGTPPLDRVHPLGLKSVPLQALALKGCKLPLTAPHFPRETAILHRAHSISRGFPGGIT